MTEKTVCRTPNAEGTTSIPTRKYEAVRAAILDAVGEDGLAFSELKSAVGERLSADELDRLGSLGWHVTTVKLEMEVAGDIARVEGVTPQRLVRC